MYSSLNGEAKVRFWQQQLSACSQSGLTAADFCRQNNLPRKSFYYWRRRLACSAASSCNSLVAAGSGAVNESSEAQSWLLVEATDLPTRCRRSSLTVQVSCAQIEVGDDFSPALLRAVVLALGPQQC